MIDALFWRKRFDQCIAEVLDPLLYS